MVDEKKVEVSKEDKPEVNRYEVAEIVTQTGLAIKDNKEERVFTNEELFAEVLNKLDNIEKAIFQK